MSDYPYPNAEHKRADEAARRRALTALEGIETEAGYIRAKLTRPEHPHIDGDNAMVMSQKVDALLCHLSILGALSDVREWHAADLAESGFTPKPGDIVVTPRAPQKWNRQRPYMIHGVEGTTVALYPYGQEIVTTPHHAELEELQRMGMRPAADHEKGVPASE